MELSRDGAPPRGERLALRPGGKGRRPWGLSGCPRFLTFERPRSTSCALRHQLPLLVWEVYTGGGERPDEKGLLFSSVCSYRGLGKGRSPNSSIFVSREHGGPEGMEPDGVIEVRNGCGIWNFGKVSLFIRLFLFFFFNFSE